MKAQLRRIVHGESHELLGWVLQVWCPGCAIRRLTGSGLHQMGVSVFGEPAYGEQWEWNGDVEAPTVTPSLAVSDGTGVVCHSFIRGGSWAYLGDCTHELAGQNVPMPDLPDWIVTRA